MDRFTGLLGLIAILALCYSMSTDRKAIKPRLLLWGLGLQFSFAFLVLKTDVGMIFQAASVAVNALLEYAEQGSSFLFGPLGIKSGPFGVVFAFQVLPIVIFIASLFSILYYFGVMQVVIKAMAWGMHRVMRCSGAESTNVAASIFMGQTEAPLTIRPFLANLTPSELFTVMTCGMAHVSGAVMAAYVKIAGVDIKHLLTAVIMTAPATLLLAKMLVPETGHPETEGDVKVEIERPGVNVIDAAARGAGDGLQLALNIGGMLIAFISLIALVNGGMSWLHSIAGWIPESLQKLFGIIFAPIAWLLGVSWKDAASVGDMLGTRMVLNEFIAFLRLGELKSTLDPRSFVITTFALCGFANFSSIAIQIGGIGALAPSRKSDLARMGLKAMMAGTLANFMSACIAGVLL
ncbi:NupC/NupG family nucleoside CNT transporter [Paludibaculum fermentans]|uniref:NupC/NupG family nucleoside CNT transporter n=1 Tax=Paludibaculum fermentans TaxID=1473598 RepID=A0A7S7NTG7_PALFE|nr:nucleoside transporter C-terminal domain-containing protein [Paludibaculum fermentans]QOY89487.1 NupC/NupG family nucleoside CNT transporter [Paludibaculum fermentans]